ncbi:MAG: response regulator transcription factor [Verrucomicrobia bacterium]|nr:response regulator transcription factor [Verrucomicrobiota bacterium]
MKFTAVIVEDEPLARKTLRDLTADVTWLEMIGEASDGLAAVELINTHKPDLVFLDIHMPELSGLDVLKRLLHEPAVVFTTTYDQHAIAAFELAAVDYLLKPFGRQRFEQALDRAREVLERRQEKPALGDVRETLGTSTLERLLIRDGGRIMPVVVREIERLEAEGDYVGVRVGGKTHLVNLPLGNFEQRLDATRFVRVHRSHLVNMDFVDAIEPYDNAQLLVRMKDGTKIIASRSASKRLRELSL